MIIYLVVLTIPGEVGKELDTLREEYGKYMNYTIEPHVTLKYPFVPKVDLAVVKKKLEVVARKKKPFVLRLSGIKYFEGGNNVAYVAIDNERPVIDLHIDVVKSLRGLVEEESELEYDPERFVPHVTLGEHIPDDVFPTVKKQLSNYELRYEVDVVSFDLFATEQNETWETWKRVYAFELLGE